MKKNESKASIEQTNKSQKSAYESAKSVQEKKNANNQSFECGTSKSGKGSFEAGKSVEKGQQGSKKSGKGSFEAGKSVQSGQKSPSNKNCK